MLAQFLISVVLILSFMEVLNRWIFGESTLRVVRFLLGWQEVDFDQRATAMESPVPTPQPPSPETELRQTLRQRRRELAEARSELRLKQQTAEVLNELARTEGELVEVEEQLASQRWFRGDGPENPTPVESAS